MQRGLWDLSTLDTVFVLLIALSLLVFLLFVFTWPPLVAKFLEEGSQLRALRRARGAGLRVVVGLASILAVWLAYGSLRNQLQMEAENSSNEVAVAFVQWERERPFIRCLYGWYSTIVDSETCLQEITSSPEKFSETLLYVEEIFFTLRTSQRSKIEYQSPYFDDIDYWRDDIEDDPTGMFAFYIANRFPPREARNAANQAGVCIPDLCPGYERVRMALEARGFEVDQPDLCRRDSAARQSFVGSCPPR